MSNKRILTGWVHRLEDGILKSYGPGEQVPDWVTNKKIIATGGAAAVEQPVETTTTPHPTGDDLDGLAGKELKAIANDLGVAKNGSLDAIRDRIRAKREEVAAENEPDEDEAHAALVEKAKELGIEVDDNMSDVELQVLIDEKE